MRILMLAQFYPPTIGGEEQHVWTLSHALAARGHQVSVVTLGQADLPHFAMDGQVRVHRIPSLVGRAAWLFKDQERRHAPPLPDPEALWALRSIIAQEGPDLIHAHNWLVHSFLPLKAWSKAKLVVTLHDYSLACSTKRLMHRGGACSGPALAKCLACGCAHYGLVKGVTTVLGNWAMSSIEYKAVDLFLPVSQAVADANGLAANGAPYQVLPNFLPHRHNPVGQDTQAYLDQLPDEDFLLFVGDVGYEKGVETLLAAYTGLSNPPPLVLIGRILPETPTQLPPQVRLLGSWPHQAVMQAWQRSLIALAPSVWPEPFGLVVIEAMVNGCPVIASRTGGITDIIVDGESGLLTPPGDVVALRQAMERLLGDPRLRVRMGELGRQRVAAFQAGVIVPRLECAYARVLQQPVRELVERVT